ncbi:MAG: zinc ribbon domain-containing protein [Clostridiaceae bacterium]|nr:zinc ribbon domain-containing protein [Clostridiaceae bacterium]
MFFIGVFGINQKSDLVCEKHGIICPICGAYGRYEVYKNYNYFHIFFIPTFRWGKSYFIKTYCCNNIKGIKDSSNGKLENNDFNVSYYDILFE